MIRIYQRDMKKYFTIRSGWYWCNSLSCNNPIPFSSHFWLPASWTGI